MSTEHIRRRVIIPLALSLFCILVAFIYFVYLKAHKASEADMTWATGAQHAWQTDETENEAQWLRNTNEQIKHNDRLMSAWEAGDREKLYAESRPLYEIMLKNRVSHYYYISSDSKCFLRVHKKEKYGDEIGRATLRLAKETGQPAHGVELGPLGTLTLRQVSPVHYKGKMLGYLETGMEIEHIVSSGGELFGISTAILLNKEFLKRPDWEDGMKMFDRPSDWDELPDMVMSSNNLPLSSEAVKNLLETHKSDLQQLFPTKESPAKTHVCLDEEWSQDGKVYRIDFRPLVEMTGRRVGGILLLRDFTAQSNAEQNMVLKTTFICLLIGGLLITFFFFYLGRVERRLDETRKLAMDEVAAREAAQAKHLEEIEREHVALTKTEKALRESERLYRHLVDTIACGICMVDEKETILFINNAGANMLGYESDEMINRSLEEFTSQDEGARYRLYTEERKQGIRGHYETILLHRDGSTRNVRFAVTPVFSDDGFFQAALSVFDDVTEQKKAEIERGDLELQVRQMQKMDAIGRLAGGIAHDFNNQLTGVLGYSGLLKNKIVNDPQLERMVQQIINASLRATKLTRQLLDFARKGKLQNIPVNVHEIISELAEFLWHGIDKKIETILRLKAEQSVIQGDPQQIQNAMLNLALNARDAMPKGGSLMFETANVDLDENYSTRSPYNIRPGQYLLIKVVDTGVGMDEEVMSHLFEPFFTTKQIGEGTGMGLPSVYGTIRDHGGAIEVQSAPGHGTTFLLYLPLLNVREQSAAKQMPETLERGSGHILVVDDEQVTCDLVTELLTSIGYRITAFQDGIQALDFYRANHSEIELVILDLIIPHTTGKELFTNLRAINSEVKVLLVSGHTFNIDAQAMLRQGAKGFLPKPFQVTELAAAVAQAMKD